jgi:hypothetical protein
MRHHIAAVAALLACPFGCLRAAEGYSCTFTSVPPWLVEGRSFTVEMGYKTPPNTPPAALHCEMKAGDGRYLSGQAITVSGAGTQAFTLALPAGDVARQIELVGWFGDDWREPFSAFARPPLIEVLSSARGKELDAMHAAAAALRARFAAARTALGLIGLYRAPGTDWTTGLEQDLSRRLTQAGYGVAPVDGSVLSDPFVLTPDLFDVVILCDPRETPAVAREAVARFVQAGGKAFFLGGRAFESPTWFLDGKWLPAEEYRAALAEALKVTLFLDFGASTLGEWVRGSNRPESPALVEHTAEGAEPGRGALHITIADLTGWDTFRAPLVAKPFPDGHTWTVFRAKGGKTTKDLAVEWTEKDGSRWIAVAPLTTTWRPVALPPSAFRYWHDSPTKDRGGPGDGFRPENADRLTVGLAVTHTAASGGGRHEFWLDSIGSAPPPENTVRDALGEGDREAPPIEGVSPPYKLYEVTNLATLRTNPVQAILPAPAGLRAASTLAPHPRPQGTGIHKSRRWRFAPLIDALDAQGRVCGHPAALVLNGDTAAPGGVAVSVPVTDPAFFAQPDVSQWLAALVRRVDMGLFLYEGGAAFYASFGTEEIPIGALVVNRGRTPAAAEVAAWVADSAGKRLWERVFPLALAAGGSARVEAPWSVPAAGGPPLRVTVELRQQGQVVDRLTHEVRLCAAKSAPRFIGAADGEFRLDSQPWFAHGVNYMPSSGIGIEDTEYFEYWLDPQPYDPDVIERDLADIAAMGMNMVSVFQYHRSLPGRNLLDLLDRCDSHGLKVNLSLRPGTPMDFPWDLVREMIQAGRLAQNDTVFAYDLAWEPFWREQAVRRPYDADWEAWVGQRYGSIAAAEKAWNCAIPRAEGRVTNPADEQVSKDGPWRAMVLDYRRFLNDLLHERYGRARELVRTIDPHHLVSFRMSIAGDPTASPAAMGYDFAGLAQAVDILQPEGYGRIGDWEQVKPGWFTTAYGRCVAPHLPVLWAEFGCSTWSGLQQDPARLEFAARFYEDFYTMAYRSGANGTVCWWFPGGYRTNERSDYGIVNPDRSWRPVTHVIKRWAEKMTAPRPNPRPDVWLEADPGRDVDGLFGLYRRLKGDFWQAVEAGRTPGLRLPEGRGPRP